MSVLRGAVGSVCVDRVRFLGEELGTGVFRAEPDAADVDCVGLVEDRDGSFVDALELPVVGGGFGFGGDSCDTRIRVGEGREEKVKATKGASSV